MESFVGVTFYFSSRNFFLYTEFFFASLTGFSIHNLLLSVHTFSVVFMQGTLFVQQCFYF